MQERGIVEITVDVSGDNCPQFLLHPFRNYFDEDDDYDIFYEDNPDMVEILSMPRKCKDIFKYLDYLDEFEKYVRYLVSKYGHEDLIRSMIESGETSIGDDKIPSMPKLTKKKNKILMEKGILPSRSIVKFDPKYMMSMLEYTKSNNQIPDEEELERRNEIKEDETMQASFKEMERRRRLQTMKSKSNAIDDSYNFITNFYRSQSSTGFVERPKNRSLSNSLEEEDRLRFVDVEDTGKVSLNSNGVYVSNNKNDPYSSQNMSIVTELQRSGFNVIGTLKKDYGKKGVKLLAARYGLGSEVSDKELKKWNKKRKKQEQEKLESHRKLAQMLTGNRLNIDELTSFSIRDMEG